MRKVLIGQMLLILCCIFYLVWWYRGFRPGDSAVIVINRLNAAGNLSDGKFVVMCLVIAAAFLISMVLYVDYYRMEEMKAYYAAMVPLITEAVAMAVLVGMLA